MKYNPAIIAMMLYGDKNSTRNAFTEEKYSNLANSLQEAGFGVESVLYHDLIAGRLENELSRFQIVLVWVNPIEQGNDRSRLDTLLQNLVEKGIYVSAHPEVIHKIGTKKVLYSTRHMEWGGDTDLYTDFNDFTSRFLSSLEGSRVRILKQYRGNGGNGVFKVRFSDAAKKLVSVIHAMKTGEKSILSPEDFHNEFKKYFDNDGILIDQNWISNITNGMVRCYLTGSKVSGFGYQESNALCPQSDGPDSDVRPTSKRHYYSEHCGLFRDLRNIMESRWVPELQKIHTIEDDLMPVLWDADFFINDVNTEQTQTKYTLCEINASCVSPFPESCIPHIVEALRNRFRD